MDAIKDRLANLENVIENLVSSLKKIEEVQNKEDLYSFTTQQLIKWLNDNEVEYKGHLKDRLVDIVWKNINEWEWEYHTDDETEEEEEEEIEDLPKKKKNNKKKSKVIESSDSESEDDEDDNFGGAKTKGKVARS